MNTRPPQVERVPLTEAEIEHLAPIAERLEQAQRDLRMAERDVEAANKLYRAHHKEELTDGPDWQLTKDSYIRQLPPAKAVEDAPPTPVVELDEPNGSVEDVVAELMRGQTKAA